jgi:hypothetical protein
MYMLDNKYKYIVPSVINILCLDVSVIRVMNLSMHKICINIATLILVRKYYSLTILICFLLKHSSEVMSIFYLLYVYIIYDIHAYFLHYRNKSFTNNIK